MRHATVPSSSFIYLTLDETLVYRTFFPLFLFFTNGRIFKRQKGGDRFIFLRRIRDEEAGTHLPEEAILLGGMILDEIFK